MATPRPVAPSGRALGSPSAGTRAPGPAPRRAGEGQPRLARASQAVARHQPFPLNPASMSSGSGSKNVSGTAASPLPRPIGRGCPGGAGRGSTSATGRSPRQRMIRSPCPSRGTYRERCAPASSMRSTLVELSLSQLLAPIAVEARQLIPRAAYRHHPQVDCCGEQAGCVQAAFVSSPREPDRPRPPSRRTPSWQSPGRPSQAPPDRPVRWCSRRHPPPPCCRQCSLR